MLSLDRTVLDSESATAHRIASYGAYAEEIHVIVPTIGGKRNAVELARNVWIYPTASRSRFAYYPDIFSRVRDMGRKNSFKKEWVITTQDPFDLGAIGYFLARWFDLPLHVQDHQDCFSGHWWRTRSFGNRLRYYVGRFVLKRADGVRVVSNRSKHALIDFGVRASHITVVPMHTPIEHIESTQPIFDLHARYGKGAFIALFVGRFAPEKNLSLLLNAFKRVVGEIPNAHLVLVGDGTDASWLEEYVRTSPYADHMHVEGWTDDVVSYLKTADCFVLSSWYEGWGRVLIEALAARLPIVTTDVGCVGEVVKDEETALVTPVGDTEAFARALSRVVEDQSLRTRFKENAPGALASLASREETDHAFFESITQALTHRQ